MYSPRPMSSSRSLLRAPRRVALVAILAALALTATSCGKGKKKRPQTNRTAEAQKKHGGFLRLQSNEPRYLNPILQTRFERVSPLIFEGLVGIDARLEPVPRLAESWKLAGDGQTITFKLRKGVKWHDGEPFTSRDVEFTYNAIKSLNAPTLWKAYMDEIETMVLPDDYTVVVKYKKPYALALLVWTVSILPKHIFGDGDITKSPANREPIGTGPFKLARWEPGKRILLDANKEWWYGRPLVDSVEFLLELPDETIMKDLREGKLDFAEIPDIQMWSNEAQLPEFRDRFEVAQVVEASYQVIAWNVQRPIFDNKNVRIALTHALNRERVIDDVLLGEGQRLSGPFFPNMFGADPSIGTYKFSLDTAAKMLDEAGYKPGPDGTRFSIDLMASESARGTVTDQVLAIFRHDLSAIGVDLKVTFVSASKFTDRAVLRDFDAAYFGWYPDLPDPDPFALLHSSQIGVGSIHAGYANPEVDRLLTEARATTNRDERKAIYHKIHAIFHEEVPYTMLFSAYGHYAWNRRVHGVNPNDVGPEPRFPGLARWWIGPPPQPAHANTPTAESGL